MIRELLQFALTEMGKHQVHGIARYQSVREFSGIINNGKVERIVNEESQGLGIQVFTQEGYSGFASVDNITVPGVESLVAKAAQLARLSESFGGEKNQAIINAPRIVTTVPSLQKYPFDKLSLTEIEPLVKQENLHIMEAFPGLSVQTVYRQVDEQWHIVTSGGSEAVFPMPRAVLVHTLTARNEKNCVTTRCALGGADVGILLDQDRIEEARARTGAMGRLARNLLTAPRVKSGHYKLVIDYALAKGLAHEAFGHAVETDGVRNSILGNDGKLVVEMDVADPRVSIVDGPIPGDWAYQPVSANGFPRDTVKIVDKGKLVAGLGDLFSARNAGVAASGAGRAESYAHIPLPRMTNIRIEVENPIPLAKSWYQVTPEEIYRLILDQGLASPGEDIYYLVGYKGGQVNTQYGDFVFNCSAIYKLGDEPLLYQPGIFAGKTLSALKSIRAGIGPMLTDALGTCGKWGQAVPSSGGSHAFLLLDAHPEITIGGE